MTPAETLAALCALRPDLPPGFKVTLPLDWLSQAADGTAAQPAPSAGAPVDTSGDLDVAGLAARYHRAVSARWAGTPALALDQSTDGGPLLDAELATQAEDTIRRAAATQ